MRKALENILPVGAPWGGPESVRIMSCFTSMLCAIEHFPETILSIAAKGRGFAGDVEGVRILIGKTNTMNRSIIFT